MTLTTSWAPSSHLQGGKVRETTPHDRSALAALAHFAPYAHQNPGWAAPLSRLGSPGFVAHEAADGQVDAALAVLPETERVAWVRLFAATLSPPTLAWDALWPQSLASLARVSRPHWVAAMPFTDWFRELLAAAGFAHAGYVDVLAWMSHPLPEPQQRADLRLRAMTSSDLPAVSAVDAAAFGEFWRLAPDALRMALARSVWATVITEPTTGRVLGFQISTPSPLGGHLARLAVHPDAQGRGLGRWLVQDALRFFRRNGAERVTLSTQGDNATALALYRRLGFHLTEERYPVYRYDLSAEAASDG